MQVCQQGGCAKTIWPEILTLLTSVMPYVVLLTTQREQKYLMYIKNIGLILTMQLGRLPHENITKWQTKNKRTFSVNKFLRLLHLKALISGFG